MSVGCLNFLFKDKLRILVGGCCRIRILIAVMIAGNPKPARCLAFCAVAFAILVVVTMAVLATHKKTPPMRVAPLRPSTFIATTR